MPKFGDVFLPAAGTFLGILQKRQEEKRTGQEKLSQIEAELKPKLDISALSELLKGYGLQPNRVTVSGTGEPSIGFGQPRPEPGAAKANAIIQQALASKAQLNEIYKIGETQLPAFTDDPNIPLPEGTEAIGKGIARKITSVIGGDELARSYLSTHVANARQVIRGLGEVGVLSTPDIKDAIKLLPASTDSATLRRTKLANLNQLIDSKIKVYQSGLTAQNDRFSPSADEDFIRQLEAQGYEVTPVD